MRSAIDAWTSEVKAAQWKAPGDVRVRYPAASFLPGNVVIFNLKGTKYRVETQIAYQTGIVLIRRAGTHAEYSKWEW